MKGIYVVASALLALSTAAFGDEAPATNPQSKENKDFEAQGEGNLGKIAKGLWKALLVMEKSGVLGDGSIALSDTYTTSGSRNLHRVDVSVETRIYGIKERKMNKETDDCGGRYTKYELCYLPAFLIVPMEVRIRANVDELSKMELNDLKVGALRVMFNKIGLTLQGASYFYKKNELGMASYDGFELLNATFNDVTNLSSGGTFELVYKVTAGVGFTGMYSSTTRSRANIWSVPGLEKDPSEDGISEFYSVGSSIGVRFKKKVMLDFFGGMNNVGDKRNYRYDSANEDGSFGLEFADTETSLREKFYGAGFRFEPNKRVNFRVTAQRAKYDMSTLWEYDNARYTDKQTANSVTGTLELRW